VYVNFLNTLSSRTIALFESKGEAVALSKDYVGINLLLALTIYNICRSSSSNNNS
jgi:hypothetical protein